MKRNGSTKKETDDEIFEELKINKKAKKDESINKPKINKSKINKSKRLASKSRCKSTNHIKVKSKINLSLEEEEEVQVLNKNKKTSNLKGKVSDGLKMLGTACIRLGLCCINNLLRSQKTPVFCSRGITLSTYKSKGKNEAITRATQNVKDIEAMLNWNKTHHIHCLRLSSDIFPHYTNTTRIDKEDHYTLDFIRDDLERIGKIAKDYGHRLTMHPGQYNVVGSPNEDAFQKTIVDLKMHADILDMMQLDANSIIVVHGGGVYGDKEQTLKRWATNFFRLPENVQRRLVIENDEKNFSIVDCLTINKKVGIPVVFDNHHFECYQILHPKEPFDDISTYIKPVLDTWTNKGLRPKFHISNQNHNKKTGAHSDYISKFPDYYLEIPNKYGIGVDIMVEAKAKEAAILDLYQRHKEHFLKHVQDEDIDHSIFKFDKDRMQAIKCSQCML